MIRLLELVVVDEEHRDPLLVVGHLLQVAVGQHQLIFEHVTLGALHVGLVEILVEGDARRQVVNGLLEIPLHCEDQPANVEILGNIVL